MLVNIHFQKWPLQCFENYIYDSDKGSKHCNGHFWKCVLAIAYETSSFYKMRNFIMFITAVCVLFLIKLRWPKNKSLYKLTLIILLVLGFFLEMPRQ